MQTTSTVPRNWLFDWVDFDLISEAIGLACFLGRHAGSRPALHLWLHLCLLTVRWIGNVEALHGHESNAGFVMSHAAVVRSWQIMILCSKKRSSPTIYIEVPQCRRPFPLGKNVRACLYAQGYPA